MGGLLLGLIGSSMIVLGVFGPFYEVPIFGGAVFFSKSPVAGALLLGCAALGAHGSIRRKPFLVIVAGSRAFLVSLLAILSYFGALDSLQTKFERYLLGWLGDALRGHVSLAWGAYAMVSGSVLLAHAGRLLRREARGAA